MEREVALLTLGLSAGVEYLQVKGLGASFLDHRDITACPLVGSGEGVGAPVRPVYAAPKEGHGKGVRQVFVAPQDLDGPTAVIQRREYGIGTVGKRDGEGHN